MPKHGPEAVAPVPPDRVVPGARCAVVFVHGFLSSAETWSPLLGLMAGDADFDDFSLLTLEYRTAWKELHPARVLPQLSTLSDLLRTRLRELSRSHEHVALVGHSMGGLVVQRMLQRVLVDGGSAELKSVRRVVLIACPSAGSDKAMVLRRHLLRAHRQEVDLRPLNPEVRETHQFVVQRVANATSVSDHERPIPVVAFAGLQDGVVTQPSAHGSLPTSACRVVPGDHSTVIRPPTRADLRYSALACELRDLHVQEARGAVAARPSSDAAASDTGAGVGDSLGGKRDVNRLLLVVGGRREDETVTRVLVKCSSQEWAVGDERPWMLPSLLPEGDPAELCRLAADQLGVGPERLDVVLTSRPFVTANANPALGERSGTYTFRLVLLRFEGSVDEGVLSKVASRPAAWCLMDELCDHGPTAARNADVFRQMRDLWGSHLEKLAPYVELRSSRPTRAG